MALNEYQALAKHIGELRREAHLSQEELATQSGIALSTLTKIERGVIKNPSVFTVAQLARALNVSIDGMLAFTPSADDRRHPHHVEFVYFDVHGVIATNWERSFTALAERFQLQPQTVELGFWRYNDLVGRGNMGLDDFERALAGNLQLKEPSLPYREVYFESIAAVAPVHGLMREVAEKYNVGLFTNIFPGFLDKLINTGVVPDLSYAQKVESCEVGSVKPERAIFEYAQKQAKTNPEHILLVDDTYANLEEAKHMGWQTFWFDPQHTARSVAGLRAKLLG